MLTDQHDVRLRPLRCVIEHSFIGCDAYVHKGFVKPNLILQRDEAPALIQIDGRGLRVQSVQAKIPVACPIVEKARMHNMLW